MERVTCGYSILFDHIIFSAQHSIWPYHIFSAAYFWNCCLATKITAYYGWKHIKSFTTTCSTCIKLSLISFWIWYFKNWRCKPENTNWFKFSAFMHYSVFFWIPITTKWVSKSVAILLKSFFIDNRVYIKQRG